MQQFLAPEAAVNLSAMNHIMEIVAQYAFELSRCGVPEGSELWEKLSSYLERNRELLRPDLPTATLAQLSSLLMKHMGSSVDLVELLE